MGSLLLSWAGLYLYFSPSLKCGSFMFLSPFIHSHLFFKAQLNKNDLPSPPLCQTCIIFFIKCLYIFEGGGSVREGDTESKAGSKIWVVSTEPDMGLEPANCEIITWTEVRCLTYWGTQAPWGCIILVHLQHNPCKEGISQFNRWGMWCEQPWVAGEAIHAHKHPQMETAGATTLPACFSCPLC